MCERQMEISLLHWRCASNTAVLPADQGPADNGHASSRPGKESAAANGESSREPKKPQKPDLPDNGRLSDDQVRTPLCTETQSAGIQCRDHPTHLHHPVHTVVRSSGRNAGCRPAAEALGGRLQHRAVADAAGSHGAGGAAFARGRLGLPGQPAGRRLRALAGADERARPGREQHSAPHQGGCRGRVLAQHTTEAHPVTPSL